MSNALNEVCNGRDAIEGWEFGTRIGVERSYATNLLAEFGQLLRD